MCEKIYPGDYRQWKTKAFIETMKKNKINFFKNSKYYIVRRFNY